MGWRTLASALDAGTAICAGINSAYFCDRLLTGVDNTARKLALFVLALISFGAMFEALALIATAASASEAPVTASASWAAVRLLPFLGAAGISALIARGVFFR
jgi:hypothetical protein